MKIKKKLSFILIVFFFFEFTSSSLAASYYKDSTSQEATAQVSVGKAETTSSNDLINIGEDLKDVFEKSLLSARGYYRVLKTARTIADLEDSKDVRANHLAEAFQYRLRES